MGQAAVSLLEDVPPASAVELLEAGVHVHDLRIARKSVADYLRPISPDEREGQFIQAVEVGIFCLERAAAARDLDFVRAQVDSILDKMQQSVSGIPAVLESGLAQKLGANDSQVLAPIRAVVDSTSKALTDRVNGVKDLLANDMDPAKTTSTLGRALGQLRDLLDPRRRDSIQGALGEAIRTVTMADGPLAKSVKASVAEAVHPLAEEVSRLSKQIAGVEAAADALAETTKKGPHYEEEVLALVMRWSGAMGVEVHHVGPDNGAGDIVLKFGDASVGTGMTVVVEARDRMSPLGRKAIAEAVDRAMAARDANSAIYLSRTRDGLAAEIGVWAEGESDRGPWIAATHEHLFVAIRFLLVLNRLAALRESKADVDLEAVGGQITRIRAALRKVSTIKRNVTAIRDSAGTIQEEAESLQMDVRSALLAIEETLRAVPK